MNRDVLSIGTAGWLSDRTPLSIMADGYLHFPIEDEEVVVIARSPTVVFDQTGAPPRFERERIKVKRREDIHRDDEEILELIQMILSRL